MGTHLKSGTEKKLPEEIRASGKGETTSLRARSHTSPPVIVIVIVIARSHTSPPETNVNVIVIVIVWYLVSTVF